jgi:ATP adenylyltransferase/5',5'''-P-1,P-4-tetraphosphate phosphorylase II
MIIDKLHTTQLQAWPLAKENYKQLESVVYKSFDFDGLTIKTQFNPGRIRSANAKVDAQSILQRPCFLCPQNRPEVQLEIDYPPHYNILLNPYPIFPQHLTIAVRQHLPQSIEGRMTDMLRLAKDLPGYTLLYNGPQAGASAPDHFHFQAVSRNVMPVEQEIHSFRYKTLIRETKTGKIHYLKNYLRKTFVCESKDPNELQAFFEAFYRILQALHPENHEPKFNIMLWFENETGYLVLFPREKHRPKEFFETGENQLLVSPGLVDMAGLLIIARKEDFEKLNKDLIADIYSQVSISDEEAQHIITSTHEAT